MGLGSIAAGEICVTRRWISLAVLLLILISCAALGSWPRFISRMFGRGRRRGKDIVAIYGNIPEAKRVVCIMAHYDTKSSLLPFGIRVSMMWLAILFLFSSSLLILSGLCSLARAFSITAGIFGIALSIDIPQNKSPGAIDNASGLGIMMEIGRTVSSHKPEGLGVIFVATDAEEEGMIGALRFVEYLKGSLLFRPDISFLNIDISSGSRWVGISGRRGGMAKGVANAMREEGLRPISIPLVGAGADHIPAMWHGFDAITVHGLGSISDLFRIHTWMDLPGSLLPDGMERIGRAIVRWIFKM
jgi:hypothetical protein